MTLDDFLIGVFKVYFTLAIIATLMTGGKS